MVWKFATARILHYQIQLLLDNEGLVQFNDVPVDKLLQNFGLLVYLVYFVRLLVVVSDVDCFHGHYVLCLPVDCSVYFSKPALPQQLIEMVLIFDLGPIKGFAVWIHVKLVAILDEVNVTIRAEFKAL